MERDVFIPQAAEIRVAAALFDPACQARHGSESVSCVDEIATREVRDDEGPFAV
jgi:hypothetical protein